jgi:hypothetical protein
MELAPKGARRRNGKRHSNPNEGEDFNMSSRSYQSMPPEVLRVQLSLRESASAKNQVFDAMLRAKHEANEKRMQMLQLQARINKLKEVEERAKRNHSEAKRQSEFILQMKEEKAKKRQEKERY